MQKILVEGGSNSNGPNLVLITNTTVLCCQIFSFIVCFTLDSDPFYLFPHKLTLIMVKCILII